MLRFQLWLMRALLVFALLFAAACWHQLLARDLGQWEDQPPEIRQWFQQLMQPDNPQVSCCGQADAFGADSYAVEGDHYVAIITDGKGIIPEGTRIPIPNHKMKWDQGNPTGHGIVFLSSGGQVFCYVAPGGV